jgi:tetratricopeptide (TPR) repeat protein
LLKKIVFQLLTLLIFPWLVYGATVTLMNGDVLEGEIIEKTDTYLKLDMDKGVITYSPEEIKDIQEEISPSKVPADNLEERKNALDFYLKMKEAEEYIIANDLINAQLKLEELQKAYPENSIIDSELASLNYRLADYQKALDYGEKAVQRDPDNFAAYGVLSVVYYIDGRKEESEEALIKAKEIAVKYGHPDDLVIQEAEKELNRIKSSKSDF